METFGIVTVPMNWPIICWTVIATTRTPEWQEHLQHILMFCKQRNFKKKFGDHEAKHKHHLIWEAVTTPIPFICHYAFYRLRDSVILDSACDIHVCNNRDRLIDLTKPGSNDYLIAGDTTVPILGLSPVIRRDLVKMAIFKTTIIRGGNSPQNDPIVIYTDSMNTIANLTKDGYSSKTKLLGTLLK
jgi:hypothetical protein